MISEFRSFTVGEIEVTDFEDGMLFIKDGEGAIILISIEDLQTIINKLKGE